MTACLSTVASAFAVVRPSFRPCTLFHPLSPPPAPSPLSVRSRTRASPTKSLQNPYVLASYFSFCPDPALPISALCQLSQTPPSLRWCSYIPLTYTRSEGGAKTNLGAISLFLALFSLARAFLLDHIMLSFTCFRLSLCADRTLGISAVLRTFHTPPFVLARTSRVRLPVHLAYERSEGGVKAKLRNSSLARALQIISIALIYLLHTFRYRCRPNPSYLSAMQTFPRSLPPGVGAPTSRARKRAWEQGQAGNGTLPGGTASEAKSAAARCTALVSH